MDPSIADLYLDMQLTTYGLDIPPQRVNLRPFNVSVLEARNSVLADVESFSKFNLGETQCFTEFSKLVRADLVEHPPFVFVDGRAIDGALRKQFVQCFRH